MARSVLNTSLEFSLVSVPIAVMPVGSKQEVDLDRAVPVMEPVPDGEPGEMRIADWHPLSRPDVDVYSRAEVDSEDIVYGVFATKGKASDRETWSDFKPIAKDALDLIEEETKVESFEILDFIDVDDVPTERVKSCYFLAPQKGAGKQLKLLHDALAATGKAGVLKIAIRNRQAPAVVYAKNGGLFMNTLAWAEDFKAAGEAGEAFAGAEVAPKMLTMAIQLVESMATDGRATLDELTDDLRPKREALLALALAGKPLKPGAKKKAVAAKDGLEELLAASVTAAGQKKKVSKASSRAKAAA